MSELPLECGDSSPLFAGECRVHVRSPAASSSDWGLSKAAMNRRTPKEASFRPLSLSSWVPRVHPAHPPICRVGLPSFSAVRRILRAA